jgi:hypothetical protein
MITPLEAAAYSGNVWGTWIRDLVVDFGYAGAIVFCGLFGGFMSWARNRFELTGAVHYHMLEVFACCTLGFGAFQNFLLVNIYSGAFFATLAVMVVVRLQLRRLGEDRRVPATATVAQAMSPR